MGSPCYHTAMQPLTRSHVEEIIACLWTIATILLWLGHAPLFLICLFGLKSAFDHFCAVYYAILESQRHKEQNNEIISENRAA